VSRADAAFHDAGACEGRVSPVSVIVFDSNETLLDLGALDAHFLRAFGDAGVRKKWFHQLLQLSFTSVIVDQYRNCDRLADAALDMAARQYGTAEANGELTKSARSAVQNAILEVPAHPDVRPALERLRVRDVRLAVLTNSTEKTVKAQLRHAELSDYFEEILSVDAVERYKPAAEAYAYAAKTLDVDAGEIRLVSAHSWDISGALRAGWKAAFVRRPERALDPGAQQPDIIADDLSGIVGQILEKDG
jgi:2-haloacid dehalogenase